MPTRIEKCVIKRYSMGDLWLRKSCAQLCLAVCMEDVPERGLSDQLDSPASSIFPPWKGEKGIGRRRDLWQEAQI